MNATETALLVTIIIACIFVILWVCLGGGK